MTTEPLLEEMHKAAIELAQLASYSEIVGQIGVNRKQIRAWCDKVFELHHKIKALEEDET